MLEPLIDGIAYILGWIYPRSPEMVGLVLLVGLLITLPVAGCAIFCASDKRFWPFVVTFAVLWVGGSSAVAIAGYSPDLRLWVTVLLTFGWLLIPTAMYVAALGWMVRSGAKPMLIFLTTLATSVFAVLVTGRLGLELAWKVYHHPVTL